MRSSVVFVSGRLWTQDRGLGCNLARSGGGRGMCGPIGVGILRHVGLESGVVFEGSTRGVYERIYRFNSKWVRKKEKYANFKWICRIFLFAL